MSQRHPAFQRLGRMSSWVLGALALLAICALSPSTCRAGLSGDDRNSSPLILSHPELAASLEIPIVDTLDGVPIIECRVNGVGPFRFIFDTGSGLNVIDQELTAQLGLKTTSVSGPAPTAGGFIGVSSAADAIVEVGPLRFAGTQVFELPRTGRTDLVDRKIRGVLGYKALSGYVVTIDALKKRLLLTRSVDYRLPRGAIVLPMELIGGLPHVPAVVDEISGWFLLDSGSSFPVSLQAPIVASNDLLVAYGVTKTVSTQVEVLGGENRFSATRAGDVSLGGFQLPRTPVLLSRQTVGAFADVHDTGLIGMPILKRFVVSLDAGRHRLVLTRNPLDRERTQHDGPGLLIVSRAYGVWAESVVPEGPAARAGVKEGDQVIAVNGVPIGAVKDVTSVLTGGDGPTATLTVRRSRGKRTVVLHLEPWTLPSGL
jgi:hypothetical protein